MLHKQNSNSQDILIDDSLNPTYPILLLLIIYQLLWRLKNHNPSIDAEMYICSHYKWQIRGWLMFTSYMSKILLYIFYTIPFPWVWSSL